MIGGNFRLDPIQAAALRVKLPYLSEWHKKRAGNAARYNTLFAETTLLENEKIMLSSPAPGRCFSYLLHCMK